MKIHKNGDIEISLKEMEDFFGNNTKICPDCGAMHYLPEWAIASNKCKTCKTWTKPGQGIKSK
jgi:hypothetical protein